MFKKLLFLPIIGLFTLTTFASADTIDGFTSDSAICSVNISNSSVVSIGDLNGSCNNTLGDYSSLNVCFNVSPNGYYKYNSSNDIISYNGLVCRSDIEFGNYRFFFYSDSSETYQSISGKFYISSSLITPSFSSDDGDSSLIPGSPDGFTSGFKPFVDSFISALSGFIPLVILYGLPILLIYIFWKRIRSYLKHFLIGGELPSDDDIANCRVYIDDKGNIKHDFSVNGYKRAVSMGNFFDNDMNTGNNRNKYSYTEQVAYGQDVYIRHDRSKSVDNAEIMDYTGQFHEAVFIRGSGYVAKRDLDCLNEDMTFNRDKMIKKYKGTNPYDALD